MGCVARLRHVTESGAEGILITGVYGSGKSSVAAEIAYLLEQRGDPYALLDLDYLGWADADCNPSPASCASTRTKPLSLVTAVMAKPGGSRGQGAGTAAWREAGPSGR